MMYIHVIIGSYNYNVVVCIELDLATLKSVPADKVFFTVTNYNTTNNIILSLNIFFLLLLLVIVVVIYYFDFSLQKVRPINFHDFEESLRQSRSSVSHELIKGLEDWNANFGVSA